AVLAFDVGEELSVLIVTRFPITFPMILIETDTPDHKLVEAPSLAILSRGEVTQLPPFAGDRGGVARLLEHLGNTKLLLRSDNQAGAVVQHTRAEGVAPCHQ